MGRADLVPFLLEDRIREVCMHFSLTCARTMSCAFPSDWGNPPFLEASNTLLMILLHAMQAFMLCMQQLH